MLAEKARTVLFYNGQNVDDLSREELTAALRECASDLAKANEESHALRKRMFDYATSRKENA